MGYTEYDPEIITDPDVYVIYRTIDNETEYMGYVDGEWIDLYENEEEVMDDDGGRHFYVYLCYMTEEEEEIRYAKIAEMYIPPAEPGPTEYSG